MHIEAPSFGDFGNNAPVLITALPLHLQIKRHFLENLQKRKIRKISNGKQLGICSRLGWKLMALVINPTLSGGGS